MTITDDAALKVRHALAHHAKELEPLFAELCMTLITTDSPWRMQTSRGGPNSYYLHNGTERRYLRGVLRPVALIEVRDRFHAPAQAQLRTRGQVRRFVERLP